MSSAKNKKLVLSLALNVLLAALLSVLLYLAYPQFLCKLDSVENCGRYSVRTYRNRENGTEAFFVETCGADITGIGAPDLVVQQWCGSVWIDDAIVERERGFVLLHELHERNQMAQGVSYNQAHAASSRLEFRCRHHPDELHDALAAEGWC